MFSTTTFAAQFNTTPHMPDPVPSGVKKLVLNRTASGRLSPGRRVPAPSWVEQRPQTQSGVDRAKSAIRTQFFEALNARLPARRTKNFSTPEPSNSEPLPINLNNFQSSPSTSRSTTRRRRLSSSLLIDERQLIKFRSIASFRTARLLGVHSIFQKTTLARRSHRLLGADGLGYGDVYLWYRPFLEESRRSNERSVSQRADREARKMKAFLDIITVPTADTPGTTLLLHFDNKRYLFGNVSEGTQRAFVQRRFGMAKISDLFITGTTNWQTTGGLLGVILTVADAISFQNTENGKPSESSAPGRTKDSRTKSSAPEKRLFTIHGGRNLTHMLATARRFVFRKGMPVEVDEVTERARKSPGDMTPTWRDSNIRVWAMAVSSSANQHKRSHEEISEDTDVSSKGATYLSEFEYESAEQLEERNLQFRKGVVGHMFDSDWRLDTLRKTKLAEVQLPAAIFVRKPGGGLSEYVGPLPGGDEVLPDIEVLVRKPWPGATVSSLPPTTPSNTALSYIVKPHRQRGKFQVETALKLGVEKGRAFSELTRGMNVTTKEGNVVTPEMVLAPGREGNGFAIVELPTVSHIDGLLNREEWTNEDVMEGISTMVWILGRGLVNDPRISTFMSKHKKLRHLISSPETSPNRIALEDPASAAIRLHQIDAERFPIPVHDNKVQPEFDLGTFDRAKAGATVLLEPKLEYDEKPVVHDLDTANVIMSTSDDVLTLAEEARNKVNGATYQAKLDEQQKDLPCKDAEVITLGTGSALPSKYRNVSATLVRVPGYGNYLFDCGENTLGQLKRVFGSELPQILHDLKIIWISHLHADHHLGTVSVIRAWQEANRENGSNAQKKLAVASDSAMIKWLAEYSEVEDFGHEMLETLSMDESNNRVDFPPDKRLEYGLESIHACHVSHCKGALAVLFKFPNGFKVAYSGDCRPSDAFVHMAKDATLLIHEATFDDELQGDAIAKKHCTTSEALEVGRKMSARRILLTHFSQRYQKIPVMHSEESDQVAIVAFDYMRCRLGDFAKLAAYRPALLKLYEEEPADGQ